MACSAHDDVAKEASGHRSAKEDLAVYAVTPRNARPCLFEVHENDSNKEKKTSPEATQVTKVSTYTVGGKRD